ncbi:MAG: carboxylating nicotinate-nucleotide diphosphorylase [Deltaproteobacteria bacterium]|nr:carboxylating nicotinate-nucleotide diphosphorylase [Deltaproteobacteria bacterium]
MRRGKKAGGKTGRDALDEYSGRIVNAALAEDVGPGDITTEAIVSSGLKGHAGILAKERFIVCGLIFAEKVFTSLDPGIKFKRRVKDGDTVKRNEVIATVSGRMRSILSGERVALNFLQRLSGIATLTGEFVKKTRGTDVMILDTRKTTPCMRIAERYAVRVGGGVNHRFGLFDAILIKDNHIKAAGGVTKALGHVIERAGGKYRGAPRVEIEVGNLKEAQEALAGNAGVIMLDNMDIAEMKKAVRLIGRRALVEASGGVTLDNVKRIASTGVDFISVGALTHSARAVDISLKVG